MEYPPQLDIISILGPTASGKTSLAVALAYLLGTEIISADSRQVYRRMDLGTGKDLEDYLIDGHAVPYHLIDVEEPGTKYNLYRYQHDFFETLGAMRSQYQPCAAESCIACRAGRTVARSTHRPSQ